MSRKILAKINRKTGEMTLKFEGYVGPECMQGIPEKLIKGLAMEDAEVNLTSEYYAVEEQQQDQQNAGS